MGKCVFCGAKTSSPYGICSDCEAKRHEHYEADVRGYFVCCPLCGNEQVKVNLITGGRDTLTCENCGARWHLYIGLTGFKWAELDIDAKDKRGLQLLGKRLNKDEWRNMAHEARKTLPRTTLVQKIQTREKDVEQKAVKEKEIIREREVIVKIRCPYCHNLHDETLDKCPHCGAKR